MAVVFLDLDNFNAINDTHGHRGGELVLQAFARRLKQSVRLTNTVALYAALYAAQASGRGAFDFDR